MGYASLGGVTFDIDPTTVSWNYQMKTAQQRTIGGTVVQVYGVTLGDLTVSGSFGNGAAGDTEGWQAQERFRKQVQTWTEQTIASSGAKPLRFLFPAYKWDFQIYIKEFTSSDGDSVHHNNGIFNPQWTLTLFIVQGQTQDVVKGIKDAYLSRLMNGVGWKQTLYNGPSASDVASKLGSQSIDQYLQSQLNDIASGGTGNSDANKKDDTTTGPGTPTTAPTDVHSTVVSAFQILNMTPSAQDVKDVETIIQYESTNNPNAVNGGDSNAAAGHPSKGYMQLIPTTFAENAVAPYNVNIFDPVSNVIAGIRYAIGKYGSLHNVPGLVNLRAGRAYVGY